MTDITDPAQNPDALNVLHERIVEMMKTIFDPEIPVNIYDLGLIYEIAPRADGSVDIKMTLTAPNCPAAGVLPPEVQTKAEMVAGVKEARVDVVWDPPWHTGLMSEAAKLDLGML